MNRRQFARAMAGTALAAPALTAMPGAANPALHNGEIAGVPFKISVMLWTVFEQLPFEQRIEKVAEAGYRAVELVGEYKNWSEEDFRRANRKRRELGITFDVTAGLAHGLGDPSGFVKLVADAKHLELLGGHLIGHDVSELLPELTLAQKWDLTANELARNVHTHPTMSEALQECFHGLTGHMINF